MAIEQPGRQALAELDRALAGKPHAEDALLSSAARQLCILRDQMASAPHGANPAHRRRLEQVNAVISVVLAGHFPLGAVPWPELEKARAWLAELVTAA